MANKAPEVGDLSGLRLIPGAWPRLLAVRPLCSSSVHTSVLTEADGETRSPGQARNGFGAGAAAAVWGPGSKDLLEHHDSQTEVRPEAGAHGPPSVEGRVEGLREAWVLVLPGGESPALSRLADHTHPWAQTLLCPPGILGKDS